MKFLHKINKLNKQGQGAVEYLQTYAWAILIIIVIGLALWQLGILSPGGRGTNTASGFMKIKVLEPSIKYSANLVPANNSLNFTIVNGAGDLIRISSIQINGDCNDTVYAIDYLDPGHAMVVTCWNCSELRKGESFYLKVNITYSTKLGSRRITHFDSGVIQGVAE
jgi:hypothetical protein